MPFKVRGSLATIATLELNNLVEFYILFLRQEPRIWVADVYAEFEISGLRFGLFKPRSSDQPAFEGNRGAMSLCLEVENLEAAIASLTELGQAPEEATVTTDYGLEIYAYDPQGNRLILYQKY